MNTPKSAPSRFVVASLFVLAAMACGGPLACRRDPGGGTLLVSSQLGGVTAPCGCTSRPLGGLDRVAFQVEAQRSQHSCAYVVVGDTYFVDAQPAPAMRGHSASTGRTIAKLLARLQPAAVAPGPRDQGPAAAALETLPSEIKGALGFSRQIGAVQVLRREIRLGRSPVTLLQLGSATAAGAAAELTAALDAAAHQARQDGAAGVVVLWPQDFASARMSLGALTQVDVVLCGSEGVPHPVETVGSAVLLDAGARGEHLGALELRPGSGGRWQFFDGGAAAVAQLNQQRARMQAEAQRLPQGPARTARLQRAEALAERQRQAVVSRPTTAHFSWRLIDIDEALPKAAWATKLLDAYNQDLCTTARADTAARACLAAPTPAETYVGSATCQACHAEAFALYERTAHARAWATLTNVGKACDLSCVGCHVVGWERPGGFCHLDDAAQWANVGCESCHGPGQGHLTDPLDPRAWGSKFVARPTATTCVGCHNAEHSDQFDFATYLPKVLGPGHGQPTRSTGADLP